MKQERKEENGNNSKELIKKGQAKKRVEEKGREGASTVPHLVSVIEFALLDTAKVAIFRYLKKGGGVCRQYIPRGKTI